MMNRYWYLSYLKRDLVLCGVLIRGIHPLVWLNNTFPARADGQDAIALSFHEVDADTFAELKASGFESN
jgi:hypothetical protein